MKVGSLFAEIGFKVDESGLDKFSTALKAFQKTIRDGLKDLKAYAQAAREISQAMREAYIPDQREARARYRAQTRDISATARQKNANARRTNAEVRAGLPGLRAETLKQDSQSRFMNAVARLWQTSQKERGLTGTHTGKYSSSMLGVLKGIANFNVGGILGGAAGLMGASHPIVMAITLGVKAVVAAIGVVVRTIREGVRAAMSYRDYMAFTGRSTRGISGLMAAALNSTNLTPEDIMKDTAGLEKSYWDMWFGGGNPRFWQMIGQLPTGNGEKDIMTILRSVWNLSGGLKNRGVARSLLGQAGLSEEYIPLMEDLMKNNPDMSPNELFSRTREQIKQQEEGNKTLREIERTWLEFKVELARSLLEVGIGDILKSISDSLRELVDLMRGYKDWSDGDSTSAQVWRFFKGTWKYGNPITGPGNIAEAITEAIKNISNTESGNVTNNIYSTNNNALTVSSTQEAADYVQEQENNSLTAQYWNLNSAYRMAPTNGG